LFSLSSKDLETGARALFLVVHGGQVFAPYDVAGVGDGVAEFFAGHGDLLSIFVHPVELERNDIRQQFNIEQGLKSIDELVIDISSDDDPLH
jgi:hypothetical protein